MRCAIVLLASVALAGCATPASPGMAADAGWGFDQTPEEGAKLAYGVSETDNVALMLTCAPRSGRVTITAPIPDRHRGRRIDLASGPRRSRLAATLLPDEGLGPSLEAHTALSDPVLRNFADKGELLVDAGFGRMALPARDKAPVRRFVEACGG